MSGHHTRTNISRPETSESATSNKEPAPLMRRQSSIRNSTSSYAAFLMYDPPKPIGAANEAASDVAAEDNEAERIRRAYAVISRPALPSQPTATNSGITQKLQHRQQEQHKQAEANGNATVRSVINSDSGCDGSALRSKNGKVLTGESSSDNSATAAAAAAAAAAALAYCRSSGGALVSALSHIDDAGTATANVAVVTLAVPASALKRTSIGGDKQPSGMATVATGGGTAATFGSPEVADSGGCPSSLLTMSTTGGRVTVTSVGPSGSPCYIEEFELSSSLIAGAAVGSDRNDFAPRASPEKSLILTPAIGSVGSGQGVGLAQTIGQQANITNAEDSDADADVHPAWGVGLKEFETSSDGSNRGAGDAGRETWTKGLDYLIATIGFAVDLATVWRFPYLCYKNGGGAFLIPYFVMLIFGGLPLFLMEVVLGQFHRAGPAAIWKIVPLFKGVGYCVCFIAYSVSFYYNVILGWSVFYIWSSLTWKLPWTTCSNEWNTPLCFATGESVANAALNATNGSVVTRAFRPENNTLAAYEFFELKVLEMEGYTFENIGPPKWDLLISTVFIFIILYVSLWQGVKSTGKVVWFTALAPYVILLILLIRGLFLPGSQAGILYFIIPTWDRLFTSEVWIEAAVQVFFSVGAGFGVHLAFASYNRFHHNCYRDCLVTIAVNCVTSVFSGVVVFAYLGYMALTLNVNIDDVAKDGPGLVFIVYPEALGTLPGSFVWAVIFFLMLFTLGIDSSMGGMESVLTGLKDEMPFISRHPKGREIFTGLVIGSSFLISIVNVTHGGIFVFTLMDAYCASTNLLFATFSEAVAIAWFYGLDQMARDMRFMLGFEPNIFWRLTWKFISPSLLLFTIVASVIDRPRLKYVSDVFGIYEYPEYADYIGSSFAYIPIAFVVIVIIFKFLFFRGTFRQRIAQLISPEWEHKAIVRYPNRPIRRFRLRHWLTI